MKILSTLGGILFTAYLLSSCASVIHPADLYDPADADWAGEPALVLGIRMEGPKEAFNQGHCRLQLRDELGGGTYETTFPTNTDTVYLDVPPGRYVGHEIQCAYYSKWLISETFKGGMNVEAGKISYGGSYLFKFTDGGKGLTMNKTPRQGTQAHAAQAMKAAHAKHQGRWISAYSGRKLTPVMLDETSTGALNVRGTWLHGEKYSIDGIMEKLRACDSDAEFEQDGVRIGKIRITAEYKPNAAPDVKQDFELSALPVTYEKCLVDAIIAYRVPGTLKLEVKM